MQKRLIAKSYIFLILLFSTGTLNIALRKDDALLERENRKPKPWPSFTLQAMEDGSYTRKWEEAFADRFLLRAQALSFADLVRSLHGFPGSRVQIITGDRGDIFAEPVGQQAPAQQKPLTQGQWVKGILVIGNHAYTTAGYEDQAMQYYANGVNGIAQRLPRDYKVFCMIAPSAIEFLQDDRYTKMSYSQTKGTDQMYAKLSPLVTPIRISDEIAKHRTDYNFHRTDHHWTARGAYHAYVAAAPVLGFEPVSWDTYKKESIPFLGTLYNATGAPALAADPDTLEVVYPPTEHKMTVYTTAGGMFQGPAVDKRYIVGANKYMSYIGGDYPLTIITTQAKTGKKILVLKDSNANAFIPFLIPHYDEVHVIDPRYWNGALPQYIKQNQIKHVLFAHYFPIISVYNGIAYNIQRITGP